MDTSPTITDTDRLTYLTLIQELFAPMVTPDGKTVKVMPDAVLVAITTDGTTIDAFIKDFTTSFFDPDFNYESDEYVGDLFVNALTGLRAVTLYPDLTASQLSYIVAYYKSNEYLKMCIESTIPNIKNYIRDPETDKSKIDDKVYGDVFEALMKGTFSAVDNVQKGLGWPVITNLYTKLTAKHPMSRDQAVAHPKSAVTEIFGNLVENPPSSKRGKKGAVPYDPARGLDVYLPKSVFADKMLYIGKQQEDINRWIQGREPDLVFHGNGNTRAVAVYNAYKSILTWIADRSITKADIEKADMRKALESYASDSGLSKPVVINSYEKYLRKDGYKRLFFTKHSTSDDEKLWSLIAEKNDGRQKYLGQTISSASSSDFHLAKNELIERYLNSHADDTDN